MKKAKAIPHVQKQSDCAAKLYSLTGHKQFYRMSTSDKVTLRPLHDFIKMQMKHSHSNTPLS